MPVYADAKALLINTNKQQYFWFEESVAANGKSEAWQLERQKSAFYPWAFAVEVLFGSSPGTFEIEIQGAEVDLDAHYVKLASISTVNGSNVGRADMLTYFPKFVRLFMKTLTGTLTVTAILTR